MPSRRWSWRRRCACTTSSTPPPSRRSARSRSRSRSRTALLLLTGPISSPAQLSQSLLDVVTLMPMTCSSGPKLNWWALGEVHRSRQRSSSGAHGCPQSRAQSRGRPPCRGSGPTATGARCGGRRAHSGARRGWLGSNDADRRCHQPLPHPGPPPRSAVSRRRRSNPEGDVNRCRRCPPRGDRSQPLTCRGRGPDQRPRRHRGGVLALAGHHRERVTDPAVGDGCAESATAWILVGGPPESAQFQTRRRARAQLPARSNTVTRCEALHATSAGSIVMNRGASGWPTSASGSQSRRCSSVTGTPARS